MFVGRRWLVAIRKASAQHGRMLEAELFPWEAKDGVLGKHLVRKHQLYDGEESTTHGALTAFAETLDVGRRRLPVGQTILEHKRYDGSNCWMLHQEMLHLHFESMT